VQYVEGLNGETARHSRVSELITEPAYIMRIRFVAATMLLTLLESGGSSCLSGANALSQPC